MDNIKVYLLQHNYEYEICEDVKTNETKIIGIYGSEEKAEEVKEQLRSKKGFNIFSEDCFYIDEYELDQNNWTEGFSTWDSENDNWIDE